jgi:hypothetical protein
LLPVSRQENKKGSPVSITISKGLTPYSFCYIGALQTGEIPEVQLLDVYSNKSTFSPQLPKKVMKWRDNSPDGVDDADDQTQSKKE